MQFADLMPTINSLRNVIDIALVFIIVYVVLKLLRGTRAVPTVVGMVILGLLYWLAVTQELSTLEFVLRYAVGFIGIAIIVLFQSEIRQALIYFANRFRFPILKKQRGQFGGSVFDEIVLAVTTLASAAIETPEVNVFIGTEARGLGPIEDCASRHRVDAALLPIDGLTFLRRPLVMDAATALRGAEVLGARHLFPIHCSQRPVAGIIGCPTGIADLRRLALSATDIELHHAPSGTPVSAEL